ncbi:MAG: formate acetyltransferase [Deltaproteobacteria bacterium]|nr:formate acetyltransferase [Deltaproteobacteria bacterium]
MDKVTLEDVSLSDITLEQLDRLKRMRERHFWERPFAIRRQPEICTELPRNFTYYRQHLDQKTDSPGLRAGKLYQYILEKKEPLIAPENLLAGTTSTKAVGVMLYPDLYCLSLWPELETMSTRKSNRFIISKQDIDILNSEVFPFWLDRTVTEVTRKEYDNPLCQRLVENIIFYLVGKGEAISHTIPNYGVVVEKGLTALIEEAREGRAAALRQEQQDFYQGVELALSGIISYAKRLSLKAQELAGQETNPKRRKELVKMSENCARVPAQPSSTFWEALNAIWICKIALHQENVNVALSLGRLDQILYPLYEQDIRLKRLNVPKAVELLGCFWLSMADHVPMIPEAGEELLGGSGSNQAITLGGVDRQGKDAVNDLTYVMLRVTELLRLRDPNVNARYHYEVNPGDWKKGLCNSRDYLERLCQVNMNTMATPCFHNDVSVIETLKKTYQDQGITLEDARDYGIVGCVEPTSTGRTYGFTGSIYINLPAALEMAMFGGKHRLTGDKKQIGPATTPLAQLTNWLDFQKALETQIKWLIDHAVAFNNYEGKTHQKIRHTPMLSALMEGCLDKGQDVICGGATYNSSGAAIIGLADVVDSVTAIQELIFNKPGAKAGCLLGALEANWEEPFVKLHAWVKHSKEKFGRESQMAEDNARWLMGFINREFGKHLNYRGGRYTTGYWTMTMHAGFGMITKALPNGRKAGESFASGITPVSGSAPELTPCLNFVGKKLDHLQITNGQALNLKYYSPTTELKPFADTVKTYFRTGGLQVQFNIIDRETLKDVMRHPDNYPKLMVRVSGYTAYFQDLNPQMQQEIITRAEYDLTDKLEHRYQDNSFDAVVAPDSGKISRESYSLFNQEGFISKWWATHKDKPYVQSLEDEAADKLLKTLLSLMKLAFWLSPKYRRKNIENFPAPASYRLKVEKGKMNVLVKFGNGKMNFTSKDPDFIANLSVTFDNSEAVINFLLADFWNALGNYLKSYPRFLGDVLHVDFGRGLRDFLLAHRQALRDFLMVFKKDILKVLEGNKIQITGNLNYLYKFAFMVNHPIRPLLILANKMN